MCDTYVFSWSVHETDTAAESNESDDELVSEGLSPYILFTGT